MVYEVRPKRDSKFQVNGCSPEDAIVTFATTMDSDMNLYFEAVPAAAEAQETKHTWYKISADGGETWTEQYLTETDVMENLSLGYAVMLVKSKKC